MAKRGLTVDDLWSIPRVGPPVPSPDGARFVVPVATTDMGANESVTRLWLVPSDARGAGRGGQSDPARPLTTADATSGQPAISPDGRRLVFVRKPGGEVREKRKGGPRHPDVPQLYVMPLSGGEPERMTDLPLGVADPRWFPDGRRIAFLSVVYAGLSDPARVAERKKESEEDPVQAYVTEDRVYRFWDRWLTDGKVHHLFVLDTKNGDLVDITPESERHFSFMDPSDSFRISPDGREIAFSATRSVPPHDPLAWGVFTVRVPAKAKPGKRPPTIRHLSESAKGNAFRPVFAPDGSAIVYGRTEDLYFYADGVRLIHVDRKSGREDVLTEAWDRSASAWEFTPDGRRILVHAEDEGRSALFSLDVAKARRRKRGIEPDRIARGGSMAGLRVVGERAWFARSTLRSPPEVHSVGLEGGRVALHSAFTARALSRVELSRTKEVTFEGAGGKKVRMFLLAPPGKAFPKKGARKPRWPLVHMIHGGPHGIFGDQWHWRWNAQAFAAPGRLVALVNFHGSTSWGRDFAASIRGRWGDQPKDDVMAATDRLVQDGLADPERMAVTGGSYGGYLVSYISTKTDRFACAVNHAGVSDFQTQHASDVTQGRKESMGGALGEEDLDGLDRYNPIRGADGFRTPMLVIHGQKDYRVPYAQGLQIYNVLKAMGVPARLVVYPDENHWILKPRNSRHWYDEVLGWLDRWM